MHNKESLEALKVIDALVLEALEVMGPLAAADLVKTVQGSPKWPGASLAAARASSAHAAGSSWGEKPTKWWPSRCIDFACQRLKRAKKIVYDKVLRRWRLAGDVRGKKTI